MIFWTLIGLALIIIGGGFWCLCRSAAIADKDGEQAFMEYRKEQLIKDIEKLQEKWGCDK